MPETGPIRTSRGAIRHDGRFDIWSCHLLHNQRKHTDNVIPGLLWNDLSGQCFSNNLHRDRWRQRVWKQCAGHSDCSAAVLPHCSKGADSRSSTHSADQSRPQLIFIKLEHGITGVRDSSDTGCFTLVVCIRQPSAPMNERSPLVKLSFFL